MKWIKRWFYRTWIENMEYQIREEGDTRPRQIALRFLKIKLASIK